ncbi:hypothetical protein NUM3379_31420 [Kineococcus sp. NUM-3379]
MSSAGNGARRVQRVAVHAVLRSGSRLLVVPTGTERRHALPATVLGHGESPADGLRRVLAAAGAPPVRTGAPVEARNVVAHRLAPDGGHVDVHTVHLVHSVQLVHGGHLGVGPAPGPDAGHWVQAATLPDLPLVDDAELPVPPLPAQPVGGPEVPVRRQRLAAYAVVVDSGRMLLTRLSERTPSPGRWTLPGGGVDHGEHPCDAAVREVLEETGNEVVVDELVEVGSEHFTGRSPAGVLEDFHALRVVVTATAPRAVEPVVLDVGGSTDLARWVPLAEAPGLGLVGVAARGLQIARRAATREANA